MSQWKLLFSTGIALALSSLARAGVVITVPGEGFAIPPYFAGTNARITAHAHVTEGTQGFLEAWLTINGEVAYHEYREPGPLWQANWNVRVMFDSARFTAPSPIRVKFYVRDDTGAVHTSNELVVANKNASAAFTQNGLPNMSPMVSGFLDSMGYPSSSNYGTWSKTAYFSQHPQRNVIYVSCHSPGAPDHDVGDSATTLDLASASGPPSDPGYLQYRQDQIGSGYPPQNSSGNPAFNFLHLSRCCCGTTNAFGVALFPYENHYGGWVENQAVWTYAVKIVDGAFDLEEYIYDGLALGLVVSKVRDLIVENQIKGKAQSVPVIGNQYISVPFSSINEIPIYGDPFTRLREVYTGNIFDVGWWRNY